MRFFNPDVPRYQKTPEHTDHSVTQYKRGASQFREKAGTDLSVTQYKRGAGPESEAKMKRVRRRCKQKVGSVPVPGKGRDCVTY